MSSLRQMLLFLGFLLTASPALSDFTCDSILNVVADFEADGTDKIEDSTAIQKALETAGALAVECEKQIVVEIPPGVFLVKNLNVRSNTTIRGAGLGKTVLKLITHPEGDGIHVLRNKNRSIKGNEAISLSGITFDGNRLPRMETKCFAACHAVVFSKATDIRVSDCEFTNATHTGLMFQFGTGAAVVSSSYSHGNGGHGFYARDWRSGDATKDSLRYISCRSEGNKFHGFDFFNSTGVSYTDSEARNNRRSGFHIDSAQKVSYEGCLAEDNAKDGFGFNSADPADRPEDIEDVEVRHSISRNNGKNGYWLTAQRASVRRVAILDSQATGNGESGITLFKGFKPPRARMWPGNVDATLTDVSIHGGTLVANGHSGLRVRGAKRVKVTGVEIHDNGRATHPYGILLEDGHADSKGNPYRTEDVTISDCVISDSRPDDEKTQKYGILTAGGTTKLILERNTLTGNAIAQMNETTKERQIE